MLCMGRPEQAELAQEAKLASNLRDETDFKLQGLAAQFEALQQQTHLEQAKLWEVLPAAPRTLSLSIYYG